MNAQLFTKAGIPLPHGAQFVDASAFYTTTRRLDDTYTERVVMDVNGHAVQIVRYDRDDSAVSVSVGSRIQMMPLDKVTDYIEGRCYWR
jgi:hypothetical protein